MISVDCAESIRVMHPLFQAGKGGSIPTSALELWIEPLAFKRALELNRMWHSILPRFGTGFIDDQPFPCFAAVSTDGVIFACAIWSNPAARHLPQVEWLELRRMAIAPDAPRYTASRMLRIMRMLLHRKRPEVIRVCSYQSKSVHAGSIYRADGWQPIAECKGDTWNRPKRARLESQQIDDRVRWERPIMGAPEKYSSPPPAEADSRCMTTSYLNRLRTEIQTMTDDQFDAYAAQLLESQRAWDRLQEDVERGEAMAPERWDGE